MYNLWNFRCIQYHLSMVNQLSLWNAPLENCVIIVLSIKKMETLLGCGWPLCWSESAERVGSPSATRNIFISPKAILLYQNWQGKGIRKEKRKSKKGGNTQFFFEDLILIGVTHMKKGRCTHHTLTIVDCINAKLIHKMVWNELWQDKNMKKIDPKQDPTKNMLNKIYDLKIDTRIHKVMRY